MNNQFMLSGAQLDIYSDLVDFLCHLLSAFSPDLMKHILRVEYKCIGDININSLLY